MSSKMSDRTLRWITSLACVYIVVLCVAPASATLSQDACTSHVYASECLADGACSWCCSLPFGSQCRSREGIVEDVCPPEARLTLRNESCAQRCAASGPQCESCESKNWCYFCTTSATCQTPEASCEGASVVQRCTTDYDDSAVIAFSKRLLISGLAMMLFATLVTSTVYGCRWYRNRPPVPRPQAALGQNEERQPLLGAGNADEAAEGDGAERGGTAGPAEVTTVMVSANSIERAAGGAAVGGEAGPPSSAAQAREGEAGGVSRVASRVSNSVEEECMCYLCLAARSTVIFLPCHHMCCCEACSNRLRPNAQSLNCPFCRRKIVAMVSMRNVLLQQPAAVAPPSDMVHDKQARSAEV